MSSTIPSRSVTASPPSLADLLDAVAQADLSERRRQDMASAIRSVARALGRPLADIPADPHLLSKRLIEVAPQALGLSQGRWSNIRSLLRAAIKLVMPVAPGRHLSPLSPAWKMLWGPLESQTLKTRLSRLFHFCSEKGIEPPDVDEATFAEFRQYLDTALLKNPAIVHRACLSAWNTALSTVPGWPDFSVSIPQRRDRWTLPWEVFPSSLREDMAHWLDRLAGHDLLAELPFRPVRPATLRSREYQIRQFASALMLRGRNAATLTGLADLVAIYSFKEGLRFLLERQGNKPTSMIADLASTMKAIARHHVRVDEKHLAQMTAVIRRIDPRRRGLTERNRVRLRAFDDRDNLLALVRLPGRLVHIAERHRHPYQAAVLVQMAVAVEILLMTGLRINNLTNLDIERHLVRPSRHKPDLHVVIAAEEVKNREPLDYPLPIESAALIQRYLEEFRPRLVRDGSTALFPGRGRTPKALNALRQQIIAVVFKYTGLRVNPHLFRHIGAKSFLDAHPGQHEVTRRVLAHRSIETTTAFYTGCETAAAVRHYDETILKLRHTGSAR
jgi:integrase